MNGPSRDTIPLLPPRATESHKGDYGRVLIIGGSRGMTGAPALAGLACLRSGAGLVTVATAASALDTVARFEASYMTAPLAEDAEGRIALTASARLRELSQTATTVACGPGLSKSADLTELISGLYAETDKPAVFDADALNALARRPEILERPGGPRVLTPHPGEFQRLTRTTYADRAAMEQAAQECAARWNAVIVLKGHRSLVTDGRCWARNMTGNPGLATGGTGDVLTGIIAALLARLDPWEAARLGAHIHGLAGDLAAAVLGQESLIASDLPHYLPAALRHIAAK